MKIEPEQGKEGDLDTPGRLSITALVSSMIFGIVGMERDRSQQNRYAV
jgi:hypothetical protein